MNEELRMFRGCLIFVVLTLTFASLSIAQNVASLKPSTGPSTSLHPFSAAAHPLQIGPGDLLDVDVFDTSELSRKLRVDDHGAISLPVGGDLFVGGLTASEAGHAIEERFRQDDVLKDPHVVVTVLEYATQGVTVYGEVKVPGVYPLLGSHSVLDLISAAGGTTANAGSSVTITHRSDPDHPIEANIKAKPGTTSALSVDVRPGDTISVSKSGIVYVLGDVGKPGGFLIDNNNRLTVLQAIALAQGTNRTAALNRATLIRKTETGHEQVVVALNKILASKAPDQTLMNEDILFVPISASKNTLRIMENILPAAAGAAIYRAP
jgi:polysaccharide biosynthesis/export protein